MSGETRRAKSLRIGVHHANAVVWGLVYRTHIIHRVGTPRSLPRGGSAPRASKRALAVQRLDQTE
eukprot:30780-Pelagococcus_subviridis.AAC.7